MITAEQIEKIRKSGLVAIAGVSVSDILDSLDACETERDRLRTEVAFEITFWRPQWFQFFFADQIRHIKMTLALMFGMHSVTLYDGVADRL